MPISLSHSGRLKGLLALVAATALTAAGLALLSTPTEAAAPSATTPQKLGYSGAPVNPAPYKLTQPDGTTLRVRAFGDHLAHGVATVNGNYSLVKGSDGFWRYASGLTASGKLKASSVIAGSGSAPEAAAGLLPVPSAKATQAETPRAGTGDDKELVILVSFADQDPVGSNQKKWAKRYFGPKDSVDDFYDEASIGKFGLSPAADTSGASNGVVGWIELPYDHPDTGITNGPDDYVADAITEASDFVDYASFDTNEDGELTTDELHVTVIGAGYETAYSGPGFTCNDGPSIWGHEWDLASGGVDAPTVDGVVVGNSGYTTFGEWHCASDEVGDPDGHMATIGIMAHEFGHDINWPDLYDVDQSGEGVGEWSLMGSGSWGQSAVGASLAGDSPTYPDAYSLYYQGWIMPTAATVANDIAVSRHQSLLLGPNSGGPDWLFGEHAGEGEFFLLENRTQDGYDQSTPGCGIVVYRIDETVTSSNSANADEGDPLVAVMQADGLKDLETGTNRGDAGDAWPGTAAKHDLSDATNPNTKFYDGTASNLALHVDETACADTMHVDVTHLGDASPAIVAPSNDNFSAATVLTGASGSLQQSTKKATSETGEPGGDTAASVWFRWTAPANGTATFTTTGSGYDTTLGAYTGSSVGALTELAWNDDEVPFEVTSSKVTIAVTAGTTYSLAGDGWDGGTGRLKLNWNLVAGATPTPTVAPTVTPPTPTVTPPTPTVAPTVVPTPANDRFGKPTKLKGKQGKQTGTTAGAAVQSKEKVFLGKGGASVWFTWTAKKAGKVTFKVSGDFAPLLAVTKGTKLSKLEVLKSDTSGDTAKVTVKVKEGRTYRIVLDGHDGDSGPFALSWKLKIT